MHDFFEKSSKIVTIQKISSSEAFNRGCLQRKYLDMFEKFFTPSLVFYPPFLLGALLVAFGALFK